VASNQRQQLGVLGAILGVLVVVLSWQWTRSDEVPLVAAAPTSAAAVPPAAGTSGPDGAARTIPGVELGALKREQPEPSDTGRDPFRFGAAQEQRRPGGAPAGGAVPVPRPAVPDLPAGPIEPPGPPPIVLKFIGFAKQGTAGRLYAILRDDRGVYYGGEGDVVEGRYRILRVTMAAVEIAYVDGRGRTNIPLTGGQP
jgi:hypothetical protein